MYKNLKVGMKLLVGFGTVTVLSVAMMIFALIGLNNVGGLTHKLFSGPYVSTTESIGIKYDLNAIGKDIRSAIIDKDYDSYATAINTNKEQLDARIAKIKAVFGGDPKLVLDVEAAEKELNKERSDVIDAIKNGKYEDAANLLSTVYADAYAHMSKATDVLYENADKRAVDFDNTAATTTQITLMISLVLLVVSLALTLFMAVLSTRAITGPMKQIEKAMDEMSACGYQLRG